MRILIYSLNFPPELTGVGKYSGELADWLVGKGHEVRVVTAMPYYPSWRIFQDYSGKYYMREKINGLDIWRSFHYVPSSVSTVKRVLHLISFSVTSIPNLFAQIFWRPNLLFVLEPTLFCAPASILVAKLAGSKTWLHIQDFELDAVFGLKKTNSPLVKRIALSIEKFIMNCFDRISTISIKMVEHLGYKGIAECKTVLLPNWADMQMLEKSRRLMIEPSKKFLNKYRESWGVSDSTYILMYAGNMGEKQGLELVIQSAQALADHNNIKFVMCGDGVVRNRLMKTASNFQNIIWLPLQPENQLHDLLRSADVHLLPQLAGIADLVLPSKLIGMMASGRPVLACASEGTELERIVKNCGVVVRPENIKLFCDSIITLTLDKELRDRLGAAGQEYVNQYLDQEYILSKFESEVHRLIEA
jgi:colanic acid biosynthesis glycosyl transferase WcaI